MASPSFRQQWKNLRRNLTMLMKHNLREEGFFVPRALGELLPHDHFWQELEDFVESFAPIPEMGPILQISRPVDSYRDFVQRPRSIARFGDGELILASGRPIPFQEADARLQALLQEALRAQNPHCAVGIHSAVAGQYAGLSRKDRVWWRMRTAAYRRDLKDFLRTDYTYFASDFMLLGTPSAQGTQAEALGLQVADYFADLRKVWEGRDITLVCGSKIFADITHNIFDNARSTRMIEAPMQHAFRQYDALLEAIRAEDPSRLIILILGPTATVLAYALADGQRMVLDLGHVAKSYDWFRKNLRLSDDFWAD